MARLSVKSLNKYLPRTGQPAIFACARRRARRRGYIGLPTEIFGRLSASVNLIHNNDDIAYLLFLLLASFLFHFPSLLTGSSSSPVVDADSYPTNNLSFILFFSYIFLYFLLYI